MKESPTDIKAHSAEFKGVAAEVRARLGMRHYLRLNSTYRSSGKAPCGKRATSKTRALAGMVITCEDCRRITGRDVMPRFDRQGRELVTPALAATLTQRAIAASPVVTVTASLGGSTPLLVRDARLLDGVFAVNVGVGGDDWRAADEVFFGLHKLKLDRVSSAIATQDDVQPLAGEVTGYEGQAAPDPENAPEGEYAQAAGTPAPRRETATPIQDLKTATPDFVVRSQTVFIFTEPCTNNWSSILRRVAEWLDANPQIEDNVTDLAGLIKYDMKADDIVSDGREHTEHYVEVLVSPSGREAKLPRGDDRPRVVSLDLSFDDAHNLVAYGDCACELGSRCVVCVARARLFDLTGDAMYADDRDEVK